MAGISRGTQDDNPCAECCPKLTFSQRVKGCLTCFCVGICISILGTMSWWAGNMGAFGVLYTFGNITSMCGSMYVPLLGPDSSQHSHCA